MLAILALAFAPPPAATTLYVDAAASASDADGTSARPFSTLHAARDALRSGVGRNTPRRVHVRGEHFLTEFALDARDAGSAAAPIEYASDPSSPARARVSGGVAVPASAFARAVGPTGVPLLKANLFDLGLNASALGALKNPYPSAKLELVYGGAPMVLARDPNVAPDGTWTYAGYEAMRTVNATGTNATSNTTFALDDAASGARWAAALADGDDLWLHGFFKFDWRDTFIRVASVAPVNATRWNVTRDNATAPQYPWVNGCRFYALNALRLVDAPGEYYVDSRSGELWFYPPGGVPADGAPLPAAAVVTVQQTVLSLDGANFTTIANLEFGDSQGEVIVATGVANVTLANLTVRNALGSCVHIDGANSTAARLNVSGCGSSGIGLTGGSVTSLEPANLEVVGAHVTSCSRWKRTYAPGVGFDCVGCRVANTTITHSPHAALQGGGSLNVFEHNLVSHAVYGSIDAGAFYVGRSWAMRGNVVRFNRFEHVRPTERLAQASCSQNAFYLDDQMSGYEFYGNTVVNATTGVLLGGGRDNRIHGNTFVGCDTDVAFDDRGLNWQAKSCRRNCTAAFPKYSTSCFYNLLAKVNYTAPPYATRFPEIVDVYAYHPCTPVNNVIEDNKWCHAAAAGSKLGAVFLNRNESTIRSWYSTASNNVEDCGGAW